MTTNWKGYCVPKAWGCNGAPTFIDNAGAVAIKFLGCTGGVNKVCTLGKANQYKTGSTFTTFGVLNAAGTNWAQLSANCVNEAI